MSVQSESGDSREKYPPPIRFGDLVVFYGVGVETDKCVAPALSQKNQEAVLGVFNDCSHGK